MASIRKRNGKYQVQVRRAGYQTLSRTFTHRRDAQEWANETELKADLIRSNLHWNAPNINQRYSTTVTALSIFYSPECVSGIILKP